MAKSSRNLLIRTSDGKIIVASTTATRAKVLTDEIRELLEARQQAGIALTRALSDAGFDVMIMEETDCYDAGDSGGELVTGAAERIVRKRKVAGKAKKKPRG